MATLTNVNMLVMGGMELIGKVRAMPPYRFIPILTLIAKSESSKHEESKQLGATGWLIKPVSGDDLVRVIKKVLPGA